MSVVGGEVGGVAGAALVSALLSTTSVERIGVENFTHFRRRGTPVIFVFWHGNLLPLVHYHRHEGIVVLVSEHADGERIARILMRRGFATVRGSSTRGGARGLRDLVRAARAGRDLALTPDGPRGPRGEFKPGALAAARITGLPVIPLAVAASPAWSLGSWDRFLVPKPFAKVQIQYLPPRLVTRDASRSELEALAAGLGSELNAAGARLAGEMDPQAVSA
ncbi:MAG: lysophospholipid acyltransferase family protein [Gemmatimonadales bacterium]